MPRSPLDPARRPRRRALPTRPRLGVQLQRHARYRALGVALLAAVALPLSGAAEKPSERVRLRIHPPAWKSSIEQLEASGADVAAKNRGAGWVDVITTRDAVDRFAAFGRTEVVDTARPFLEIARERAALGGPAPQYKTYAEVTNRLLATEALFPEIARVVDLTDEFGVPPTWEGRHVLAMKISDQVELDEAEPAVLIDSLHHARELNTIEVALDIIDGLTSSYASRPRAAALVDALEIWVVPVVNPDGLEYVWSDEQFWRKNRRDNGDGTFGVDLNRNYPFLWGECGNNSGNTSSDVYRGPAPASEPEVQALMALADSIRPVLANSYHSSGREVLPPYVCADLAEAPVVDTLRDLYRTPMDYDWRVASSSGESFEWMYNQTSSVAYLTEIGTAFQPPFDETEDEVERVRPGWLTLLETLLDGPLVSGVVSDAVTGEPVEAEISSDRILFTEGERRASDALGFYGWILPPGEHELTFSAPGYLEETATVTSALGGVNLDVALTPVP